MCGQGSGLELTVHFGVDRFLLCCRGRQAPLQSKTVCCAVVQTMVLDVDQAVDGCKKFAPQDQLIGAVVVQHKKAGPHYRSGLYRTSPDVQRYVVQPSQRACWTTYAYNPSL